MGGCEFETEAVAVVGELSGAAGGVTILCGAKSSTLQVWMTWNCTGMWPEPPAELHPKPHDQ